MMLVSTKSNILKSIQATVKNPQTKTTLGAFISIANNCIYQEIKSSTAQGSKSLQMDQLPNNPCFE